MAGKNDTQTKAKTARHFCGAKNLLIAVAYDVLLYCSEFIHLGLHSVRLLLFLPLEDCLTGLKGSSTQAETGCIDLQLICTSVADCQALARP